jgi:hypothetical protein
VAPVTGSILVVTDVVTDGEVHRQVETNVLVVAFAVLLWGCSPAGSAAPR